MYRQTLQKGDIVYVDGHQATVIEVYMNEDCVKVKLNGEEVTVPFTRVNTQTGK
jgi:hypothetical protein